MLDESSPTIQTSLPSARNDSRITNQLVALLAIFDGTLMLLLAFLLTRTDKDMKLIALTALIGLANNVMGIAGTLLVGVQAYKTITAPSGSSITTSETSSVKTPPVGSNQ